MVAEKEELLETLNVVKRNGKKVSFDGSKIAIAIKKGFDSVVAEDENGEHIKKYNEKDIQKVYHSIIKRIEKENEENYPLHNGKFDFNEDIFPYAVCALYNVISTIE